MNELPFEPALRGASNRPGSIVAVMGVFRGIPVTARQAVLVGACVLVGDVSTKAAAISRLDLGRHYWLVDDWIGLQRTTNRGIAFGLGEGSRMITVAVWIALIALGWLMLRSGLIGRTGGAIAIGAIVGGAIGNLIDRIRDGAVTDFFVLGPWPRFNMADAALTVGILMLVIIELRNRPVPTI